jgi:hypothetical protein
MNASTLASGRSTSEMAVLVCVVLTSLLIVAVISYIVYRFVRKDLSGIVLIKDTRRMYNQSSPMYIDSSKLPVTSNGQQFSFSFWLYVTNFQATDDYKVLFVRGSRTNLSKCNPVVFMDRMTNKLYISLTTNIPPNADIRHDLSAIATGAQPDRYLTGVIEYVPLQRWVHVAFTVQDRLLTIYQDGELYTVESVTDSTSPSTRRPIIGALAGDMVIGAPAQSFTRNSSLNAFMGRFSFFNYALTQKDVYRIYNTGPRGSNVLGAIGLSEYAMRSPVYRLDS